MFLRIFAVVTLALPFARSESPPIYECVVDDVTYENGDTVGSTTYQCVHGGLTPSLWTSLTIYCRDGKLVPESENGECYDGWHCCQTGNSAGCIHPSDECSPRTCSVDDIVYEDGALVEGATYHCIGWGAAQSQWMSIEKYCRDGEVEEETNLGECHDGWSCCPSPNGETAGCVPTDQDCNPTYCNVDGVEYQDGEVIRDIRHDCTDNDELSFTITQEVCRSGSIAVETFDGACDSDSVCCQYGDFVGCTSPSCEAAEGKDCFFAGDTYKDKAVIGEPFGYTCPYWGAGQSEVHVHENVCDDGEVTAQTRSIPCDHNWACCQIGTMAQCSPSWQDCPTGDSFSAAAKDVDSKSDSSSSDKKNSFDDKSFSFDAADEVNENSDSSAEVEAYHGGGNKPSCYVDGKEYLHGETIRDVRHDCIGWGAAAQSFTITQEVCKKGKVKTKTYESECDEGMCCQYGDFVGCTVPDCDTQPGRTCFFAGNTYEDGAVVNVVGYTCPTWGAGAAQVIRSDTMCRDGSLKVEDSEIPCANGWVCCQIGLNAACFPSDEECRVNSAGYDVSSRFDSFSDKVSSKWSDKKSSSFSSKVSSKWSDEKSSRISSRISDRSWSFDAADEVEMKEDVKNKVKDVMDIFAIAEFVEDNVVKGEVVVDENGNVEINLDVAALDTSVCGSNEKILYAIYEEWNGGLAEKYGLDCNAEVIGDKVFDPFKTDKECGELSEEADYLNCKLGDLSGRFGALLADDDGKISFDVNLSYSSSSGKRDGFCGLRLSPEVVYGRSVVFFCGDAKKIMLFCAPFDIKIYDEGKE